MGNQGLLELICISQIVRRSQTLRYQGPDTEDIFDTIPTRVPVKFLRVT